MSRTAQIKSLLPDSSSEGLSPISTGIVVPSLRTASNYEPLPHPTGARRLALALAMPPTEARTGNQPFQAGALHLLPCPSERCQRLPVHVPDHAVRIHDQHCIRRCLENGPVVPVAEHGDAIRVRVGKEVTARHRRRATGRGLLAGGRVTPAPEMSSSLGASGARATGTGSAPNS